MIALWVIVRRPFTTFWIGITEIQIDRILFVPTGNITYYATMIPFAGRPRTLPDLLMLLLMRGTSGKEASK
jgi:hypothetical protein